MPEVTIVRRFSYRHEADIVRTVLEAGGIAAYVTSDDCGSVDPALGLVRGAGVAVADDDVERAEELLADAVLEEGESVEALEDNPGSTEPE